MKIPEQTPLSELHIKEASLADQLKLVRLEIARQMGLAPLDKSPVNASGKWSSGST